MLYIRQCFLAGKAASIAQAIVNTEEGVTKALAQGGAYGSILAGVVRATGYASVGMIAAQTIAGFATGGKNQRCRNTNFGQYSNSSF